MNENTHTATEGSKKARYRDSILPGMEINELLDALERAAIGNSFGSHDEQIQLIRAEIVARTGGNTNTASPAQALAKKYADRVQDAREAKIGSPEIRAAFAAQGELQNDPLFGCEEFMDELKKLDLGTWSELMVAEDED